MEHIKQQIEAFKQSAIQLANNLTGDQLVTAETVLKLMNVGDSINFNEKEAEQIGHTLQELGFRKVNGSNYGDGIRSEYYFLSDSSVWFYVKESTETEIDRLRKRLAELGAK